MPEPRLTQSNWERRHEAEAHAGAGEARAITRLWFRLPQPHEGRRGDRSIPGFPE
jgi:hypothetical protein